jgi:hypothetical protein
MNPRVGSGMQQARKLRAEQAVEVVRNHEDGTGSRSMAAHRPKEGGNTFREWTLGSVDGGARDEARESGFNRKYSTCREGDEGTDPSDRVAAVTEDPKDPLR